VSCAVKPFYAQKKEQLGFAYLSLLIFISILGMTVASVVQVTALVNRRAAEEALLVVGGEYANALFSYSLFSPPGAPDEPLSLQELLRDTRKPGEVKRHLRQLYPDPVTGGKEWGVVADPETNRIQGVFSQSESRPVKLSNFPEAYASFANKTRLREWVFTPEIGRSIESGGDTSRNGKNNDKNKKFIDPSTLFDPTKKNSVEESPKRNDGFISPNELQK